jgi:hypothetical protein
MVRRILNFLLVAAMIVGAGVTYSMKRKAEIAAAEVARIQAEVAKEKDRLALLKAEWSMLTQPGRLQGVVEKYADYFELAPFAPDQIAAIDEIPLRPVGGKDDTKEILARMAASEPGRIK